MSVSAGIPVLLGGFILVSMGWGARRRASTGTIPEAERPIHRITGMYLLFAGSMLAAVGIGTLIAEFFPMGGL